MIHIQLGEIVSTGDKFSIVSVLNNNGRKTEKRAFLPRDNMRIVTTKDGLNPFILLGARDNAQVNVGDKIAFTIDRRWDPEMGKYPTAFAWGLWEDPRFESSVPDEPVIEEKPVVATAQVQVSAPATPAPAAPYSTPHKGRARHKNGNQRRRPPGQLMQDKKPVSEGEESYGLAWPTEKGHYDPDYYQVGLAEGAID